MKKILIIAAVLLASCATPKKCCSQVPKVFKFATFYAAANGGTSISDVNVYSVVNGLETETIETPFDYSLTAGIRKIKRFGYENRANTFYNGTENTFSDAATIGRVKGFEYLFEVDYKRQEGVEYLNQNHFLRYISDKWLAKVAYVEDGFTDIKFFQSSQRAKFNISKKLSVNVGITQRLAEPYGFDPLADCLDENGDIHYTWIALEQGYEVNFISHDIIQYKDPQGNIVAENTEVWEAVVIPEMLNDFVEQEKGKLDNQWNNSLILGYDFYHFTDDFWVHSWGNLMPYHYDNGDEFSFHNYNNGEQWLDYAGGLIFGYKFNKHLGCFIEGTYNKYWNREWQDFSVGLNYVIF